MTGPVVRVDGVSFRYGLQRRWSLRGVSVATSGGVVALLGPNGAGKSTLLRLVAGVVGVQQGRVEVGGVAAVGARGRRRVRAQVGFLPQRFDLMAGLRAVDTVAHAGWVQGLERDRIETAALAALDVVGLRGRAAERVRRLSGGQRQRLGIAAAIVHDPAVLVLDEPTVGLDPGQVVDVREHLRHASQNRTVLVSTHLMDDVDQLCERVVVLDDGEVVHASDVEGLRAQGQQASANGAGPGSVLTAGYQAVVGGVRS